MGLVQPHLKPPPLNPYSSAKTHNISNIFPVDLLCAEGENECTTYGKLLQLLKKTIIDYRTGSKPEVVNRFESDTIENLIWNARGQAKLIAGLGARKAR